MTKSSSNDVMVFLSLFRERTLVNFTICGAAPDHDCFYDFEANVLNLSTAFQERQDWKRWLLHELAHILARQGRTRPVRDLELANLCVAAANDDPGSRIELIANTFEFCMTVMKQRWYEPSRRLGSAGQRSAVAAEKAISASGNGSKSTGRL